MCCETLGQHSTDRDIIFLDINHFQEVGSGYTYLKGKVRQFRETVYHVQVSADFP